MGRVSSQGWRDLIRQNGLLRDIVDRVRKSLELKVVLQTAVDELAALFQVDRCLFFWYYEDTQRIQVICASTAPELAAEASSGATDNGLRVGDYYPLNRFGGFAAALAEGKPIVHSGATASGSPISRLQSWTKQLQGEAVPVAQLPLDAAAGLLIPVRSQDGQGWFACLSHQPRRWATAEVELMPLIAQQLEIAISQAQLYEQTQKQAQRERLVNQITSQTRQSFELETILKSAIVQLLEALNADRCLVHLVDDPNRADSAMGEASVSAPNVYEESPRQRQHLYEVCRPPFPASIEDFDTSGPITQWVIQNRRRVVISDVTQDDRIGSHNAEYQKAQIRSSLVIPVQTKENLYAILYLNQCSHTRYWSKGDQKLAMAVADQLAISIQQAHLYAQTQRQAAASAAQAQHLAATLQELQLTQTQLIQSEKISSLGRMVAGVAHEINNPINFIYGNIPYVEDYVRELTQIIDAYRQRYPNPDADLQKRLEQADLEFLLRDLPQILRSMRAGADRIRQVVLSLRNFSRLDEAHRKVVDIHEGIESTLLILRNNIQEDITILRQYGSLPPVECYPSHLNQVFMNLLINAVEALANWKGDNKTIAICTDHVLATSTHPEFVRVVVADNGPGISHDIQSKIFDPFFTTKEVGQGAGLGLTVSYQTIVELHRGSLKFYSEPGLGCEFLIEIPVQHSPASPSGKSEQSPTGAAVIPALQSSRRSEP